MGRLLGYVRRSTTGQNAELQVDEPTAADCWRAWTDHASRSPVRRPQPDEVPDRLARSLRHPIDTVDGLDERGGRTYDGGGLTVAMIGRVLGVSRTTVDEALQ